MSTLALVGTYTKYSLIETARVPMAVIGALAFPALALLAFVAPQRFVADDPVLATQAIISLAVFAVMSSMLFSFGLSIAEDREKPWVPYLRTLPASGLVRVTSNVIATAAVAVAALIPVVVIGAIVTRADASWLGIVLGFLAIAASAVPFALVGAMIGSSMPSKAAIAVVQIAMFSLAFLGGLFLPPVMFPDWLNTVSAFTPTRQARELVIWAVQGGELVWWAPVGLVVWSIVGTVAVVLLHRRDTVRRFR